MSLRLLENIEEQSFPEGINGRLQVTTVGTVETDCLQALGAALSGEVIIGFNPDKLDLLGPLGTTDSTAREGAIEAASFFTKAGRERQVTVLRILHPMLERIRTDGAPQNRSWEIHVRSYVDTPELVCAPRLWHADAVADNLRGREYIYVCSWPTTTRFYVGDKIAEMDIRRIVDGNTNDEHLAIGELDALVRANLQPGSVWTPQPGEIVGINPWVLHAAPIPEKESSGISRVSVRVSV